MSTVTTADVGARRFWALTWTLAITEFKLRFYGSALGYLWQIMRPLLLFGVLYVVFAVWAKVGDIEFRPVVLLMGIVLYTFVAEAISGSVTSVVDREALIRKVEFPRMAIPCSVVLTACLTLATNLIIVVIFAVASGVDLHLGLWLAPVGIALLAVAALGAALIASALYVRYRDVKPISEVGLQLLFYGTPLLYPIEEIPPAAQGWLMLNPLALVNQALRHAAIDPSAPSPVDVAGWPRVLAGIAIAIGLLVIGYTVFRRRATHMAEEL